MPILLKPLSAYFRPDLAFLILLSLRHLALDFRLPRRNSLATEARLNNANQLLPRFDRVEASSTISPIVRK